MKKKKKNRLLIILGVIICLIIAFVIYFKIATKVDIPIVENTEIENAIVSHISDSLWLCQDNWLHENTNGIWEMSISGKPFEMGVKNGKLTKKLAAEQEDAFFGFIKSIIPSNLMLHYLKFFISWFNKDLDSYIPLDLRKEIYGISIYSPKKYEFVAPNYLRALNYHAAHDIGHTIQNMNIVGCTAFGLKGSKSANGKLIIGRNFDFSAGDAFASNKIVAFCNPDKGYSFMYITWAGMIGVLSGMNEYGLTVTLNSAKSSIPISAKTPVCLVAREILQYAKNISQAYEIAKKYDTFVSEMFFIGSAEDKACAVIDKSIEKTALYQKKGDQLILTNYFQSDTLKDTELNKQAIREGSSKYRYDRVSELLAQKSSFSVQDVARVLRNQKGLNNEDIGMGNEKAINQLICHHSVIFEPEDRLVWVSDYPYQIGTYKCYDLKKAFSDSSKIENIYRPDLNIKADDFLDSQNYENFKLYKKKTKIFKTIISDKKSNKVIRDGDIRLYIALNSNYYYTHYIAALCFEHNGEYDKALKELNVALTKVFPRNVDKQQTLNEIKKIKDEKI